MSGERDPWELVDELTQERDRALANAEASRRSLEALQSTTVAVAEARSTEAAIEVVLGMGLQAAGAAAGLVAMAEGRDGCRVVAAAGYAEEQLRPAAGSLVEPDSVLARTATGGEACFAPTREQAAARFGPGSPFLGEGYASAAVLPLQSGSVTIGALALSFLQPQGFDEQQVVGLSALANLAAAALVRVRLLEEEEGARAEVAALAERNAFLAQATALVSAPLDERSVLERLARLCVPRLGDWCSITRPQGDVLQRVIVHHHDPDLATEAKRLEGGLVPLDSPTPVSATFRTGVPQLLPALGRAMALDPLFDEAQVETFRRLGDVAGITVPIGPASRPVGVLAFAVGAGRTLTEDDVELAGEIALRAGIAVSHAENFARERDAAALLQRAILPAALPALPGLELAAAYRPADIARTIGGDWFDACALDEHHVAVAVGDVAGHGMSAAAAMGQLRNALRAYLLEGHGPGEALRRLNRVLLAEGLPHYATVVVGVLDVRSGELVIASAGHLPPVLAGCGAPPSLLEHDRGPMLGVLDDGGYPEHRARVAPGEVLVLFTDGLVERRTTTLDEAMAELCTAVAAVPPRPGELQAWCDDLVRTQVERSDHDDDSCVLVLRTAPTAEDQRAPWTGAGVEPVLRLELDPGPGVARAVRQQLGDVFAGHPRLGELQLCASEVVTNAVVHARTPFTVSVHAAGQRVSVAVRDASPALPQRQQRSLTAPSGRGLQLLDALTERWGVERVEGGGKVVWFELAP